MAQKVHIVLVDDIDGSTADETVSFGLDGKDYEIDLTTKNAESLREALAPFLGHARRAVGQAHRTSSGRRRADRSGAAGPNPTDIRAWARSNGFEVSDRGRVSAKIRDAYLAAH